jgi:phage protein D
MTFHIGRTSAVDLLDYQLLTNPSLQPFSRVVLLVRFAIAEVVLMDGIITNQQLNPSNEPGSSTLTVTGEDVSVMMDLEEGGRQFPAQFDYAIVSQIVGNYGQYGLVPPMPPASPAAFIPPLPLEEIPQKTANLTDRAFLQELASLYGFQFYVTPGPAPLTNTVHWGPPERLAELQGALSVNLGPKSNVESINFSYDGMRLQRVAFDTGKESGTINSPSGLRNNPLARNRPEAKRLTYLTLNDSKQARIRAQGIYDRSFDEVVTATGELDALRYNKLLKPRALVGVRGVGQSYDGSYYVKSVTHRIEKGRYTQGFTLTREGTGTLIPFVLP